MAIFVVSLDTGNIDEYSTREDAEKALSKNSVGSNMVEVIEGEKLELEYTAKIK